jgi:site-specific recombinase XerD
MTKPRQKPLRVPSTAEIERLLRGFSRAPTAVRNRAIVATCWRSGLRCAEALALEPGDVDRAGGKIIVRRGKGSKHRSVGADAGLLALIDAWIALRPTTKRGVPLFCTLDGGAVSTSYVRSMLLRKCAKLGIEPPIHAHALRHAYATGLVREGFAMPLVQRLLGHSQLAVTAQYLDSIGANEAVEAAARRVWALDLPEV